MGVSGIAIQLVSEGNFEASVQFLIEWVSGGEAEARSTIDPTGKVFMRGTLWSARLADGVGPVKFGDKVQVEAVDGLTLVVRPVATTAKVPQVNSHQGS